MLPISPPVASELRRRDMFLSSSPSRPRGYVQPEETGGRAHFEKWACALPCGKDLSDRYGTVELGRSKGVGGRAESIRLSVRPSIPLWLIKPGGPVASSNRNHNRNRMPESLLTVQSVVQRKRPSQTTGPFRSILSMLAGSSSPGFQAKGYSQLYLQRMAIEPRTFCTKTAAVPLSHGLSL